MQISTKRLLSNYSDQNLEREKRQNSREKWVNSEQSDGE